MIQIKIDKSNKCNGDYSLYILFPYDINIVSIMKNQTIRYYNPETKEWEIPYNKLDKIKNDLQSYKLSITDLRKNGKISNKKR